MILPVTNKEVEIFFDEPTHKYVDQFGNNYTSVTTLIGKYTPEFNKDYWSVNKAQQQNKSVKQVLHEWDNIRDAGINKGNITHNTLECGIKNVSIFNKLTTVNTNCGNRVFSVLDIDFTFDSTNISIDELGDNLPKDLHCILPTIKYYVDKGYRIYSEVNVFHPHYLIAGTIDVLLVNSFGEFVIVDWKTNRKPIHFTSGYNKKIDGEISDTWISKNDRLLYPLDGLPDCKGSIYTLQLSTYATLLSAFGLVKRGLILFHIRDSFINNQYGMPVVNKDGSYTTDPTKGKNVEYYVIKHLDKEVELMITNYRKDLVMNNQLKLM